MLSAKEQESLKMLAGLALDQVHVLFELDELRQQASLLVQAEAAVNGGAWEMDLENKLAVWSSELYALHEADPTEAVTFEVLPRYYPNGEAERLTEAVTRAVSTGAGFDLQLDYVTKLGQRRCARITARVEPRPGRTPRIVGSFQDVTPQKVAEAKWRKASLYDAVTGLPNQSRFYARLEASCASGQPGALVVIGLDHFKAINEGRGRAFGDSVLRAIGEKLVADLHHGTFVARLGGDEFGVLLADVQTSEALTAQVQTVRAAVDATLSALSSRVVAGASLGVVVYPDNASTAQDVMVASDVALRNAKASGGRWAMRAI
ncbi:MAG: GGDEF domain-containing protein, partial [Proteobacteria bacterium]